jgi:hypothetical protein
MEKDIGQIEVRVGDPGSMKLGNGARNGYKSYLTLSPSFPHLQPFP